MTSAQLILVSVSSALIAVIAMLVVATVLRARTRESTGSDLAKPTGPQTRAQRAAARAQKKAQRATTRAELKAAKAAASVTKAEKGKIAALAATKTEPTDEKSSPKMATETPAESRDGKDDPKSGDIKGGAPDGAPRGEATGPSAAGESSSAPDDTDILAVPGKRDDEVATTEAGKKAADAKPRARRSLLGRGKTADDSPEKES